MRNFYSRAAALLLLSSMFCRTSFAEGTKEMMPGQTNANQTNGVAIYINKNGLSGPYRDADASNRIKFTIKDNTTEFLYFGVQARDRYTNAEVAVYYRLVGPAGNVVTGQIAASSGNGHIDTYTEAVSGPEIYRNFLTTLNIPGYTPVTINPASNGDYYLEIYTSSDGGTTANTNETNLVYFDFTVASPTNTATNFKSGRIHCQAWSLVTYNPTNYGIALRPFTAANQTVRFYGLTADSTVASVGFNEGFQPLAFVLYFNKYGTSNTDNFVTDRKSITSVGSSPILPGYQVFLNEPQADIYPRSAVPSAPVVIKIYGCSGNYYLSYGTTAPGDVAVLLDLNGTTGFQAGTSDRYLYAYDVPTGINTIAWDGKDGLGNTVSTSANVKTTLYLRRGRTNLPISDAELNVNGFAITGVSPVTYQPRLFWDDASLTVIAQNTTIPGIDNSIVGQTLNSNGLGRAWNGSSSGLAVPALANGGGNSTGATEDDYGNVRVLNTWFWTNEIASTEGNYGLPGCDKDGDGISDINDLDDDNDGIADIIEDGVNPTADADADGIPNYLDRDYGTLNSYGVVASMDSDGDGIIDSYDLDSDNDGIVDLVEAGGVDTDGNGTTDFTGTWASNDTDNDGLLDRYDATETNTAVTGVAIANLDSDGDGIPNFKDLDSDNDGIPDVAEVGGVDANGDGRLDNFTDTDGDGLADTVDGLIGTTANASKALVLTGTYISTSNPTPVNYIQGLANTDGRGLPNPYDVDSDDDGIADIIEAGGTDANYDGKVDYTGTFVANDSDGDGFINSVDGDANNDGTAENTANALLATGADTNNDGKADSYLKADNADGNGPANPYDLDSDDDGIPDLIESGGVDINGGGRVDVTTDANNNGWVDTYDPTVTGGINIRLLDVNGTTAGGLVFDFDGDGIPNYLDLDSDNDGIPDIVEQGGADANNDGKVDTYTDLDNDGFADIYDPRNNSTSTTLGTALITSSTATTANNNLPTVYSAGDNVDNTGLINMLDLDADGDGIVDTRESGIGLDINNDGVINSSDAGFADANGDGWADNVDALGILPLVNSDSKGNADFADIDSDDDGIPDNIEDQTTAAYTAPSGNDTDGDGIDDTYDNVDTGGTFGGNANNGIIPVDTDADGVADYKDIDSDADGKTDRIEGWDTNGNGAIGGSEKAYVGTTDTDGDGLLDEYDAVTGSAANYITNVNNSTTPSSYPDLNNPGGDRDWRQVQALDTDKDGIPDATDADDDNDGILDTVECPTCTTTVFQNGSFELPVQANGITTSTSVPGWKTTATDNAIEIWRNMSPAAYAGVQMVELNANQASTLYQNFCLSGRGATILWSVKHRGRSGVDVASVGFGTSATTLTTVATMTDGTSAWGAYNGSYTVPAGVTNLFFGLTAVSTATGDVTIGNFIDDVQITIIQNCDTDGDGIPDQVDLDSDGDGIADIVEAGGIDTDGNGKVDFTGTFASNDTDGDGLINTYDATTTGGVNIANLDTDGDGIPNYKDLDSDGDGIPDVVEAGGADTNNDGKLDSTTDTDNDGIADIVDGDVGNDGTSENTAGALIITSTVGSTAGRPASYPRANADKAGLPNPYDLDSDGDGILDSRESGLAQDTNNDGVIKSGDTGFADANGDGWADAVDALATLTLPNTDGRGSANYLDIDSDDDGITDNVEGQATATYKLPTSADADGDGIDDAYDNATAAFGGNANNGITPNNYDNTDTPDYIDTDADNDGFPDFYEAQGPNYVQLTNTADTDGDGLLDQFDIFNMNTQTTNLQNNVTSGTMGANGSTAGPSTSGSNALLPNTNNASNRDWRNQTAVLLPIKIVSFGAVYNNHVTKVNWVANNEARNDRYVVERSTDGTIFQSLTTVAANGNSGSYNYSDNAVPNVSTVYYRLKMVDANGNITYSQIIAVKLNSTQSTISVYPNPVIDQVTVSFKSTTTQSVTVNVYTMSGKLVMAKKYQAQAGTNTIQMGDWNSLPVGDYIIELVTGETKFTQKLSHLH